MCWLLVCVGSSYGTLDMARELENIPETPIDQLRRQQTAIELLEEHADEQLSVNRRQLEMHEALAREIRELREMYMSDRRVWRLAGKSIQVIGKWGLYIGGACIAWAWSHWDKIEIALGRPPGSSK